MYGFNFTSGLRLVPSMRLDDTKDVRSVKSSWLVLYLELKAELSGRRQFEILFDEKIVILRQKLSLFSRYLSFCQDFFVTYQNDVIRKIRLVSNFRHHSLVKKQL